jgi:hypothetical protein
MNRPRFQTKVQVYKKNFCCMLHVVLYMVFLMYQSIQKFYNKQINIIALAFFYLWKYDYMFHPCWVIIRQSLHEYVTVFQEESIEIFNRLRDENLMSVRSLNTRYEYITPVLKRLVFLSLFLR